MTQRVFITGGASGLGRALAMRYAREGARICIGDINPDLGAQVATELRAEGGEALFVNCDVRRINDLEQARDLMIKDWAGSISWSITRASPRRERSRKRPWPTGNGSSTST